MMSFATRSVLRGSIKVNRLYTTASSTRIPSGFATTATAPKSNSKSSESPMNAFNNKNNNILNNITNNSSVAFGIVEFMVYNDDDGV
ncbi:hypothetical protein RB653_000129 [Dictyostelium firmibasis]|uniref:Uncharacterized protein n=1 Tax=Dictyostelium firmibasis TaxID=79012 RepID=A0AAN7YVP0_9MYCE